MKRKELAAILRSILDTLAAQETPPPKPKAPPVPPPPPGAFTMRQGLHTGTLEVWDGHEWVPAHWRPSGYQRDEDGGYWKPFRHR